uniref:Plastocyanin-like domain-containing protein n=1 Tax=Timema shepardi TaxID=629360 RepID=A0A7R9B104_TIMSH|nr:unnamed protein product [Timema shepardi]
MTLGGDSVEMGRINNISYVDPPVTPISQHLSENYICNRTHLSHTCKKSEMCVCTHIEYLPLNKVVEFVFYNPDNPQSTLNHPMHHHGVSYQVRGMGTFPANFKVNEHNVRKLHESGKLCSNRDKYPLMDTVPLFAHGYLDGPGDLRGSHPVCPSKLGPGVLNSSREIKMEGGIPIAPTHPSRRRVRGLDKEAVHLAPGGGGREHPG